MSIFFCDYSVESNVRRLVNIYEMKAFFLTYFIKFEIIYGNNVSIKLSSLKGIYFLIRSTFILNHISKFKIDNILDNFIEHILYSRLFY